MAAADSPPTPAADLAIAETRAWLDHAVIGLNLCPFANGPRMAGRIRFVCCDASEPEALLTLLTSEMRLLSATAPAEVETTLLIHPRALLDFLDYNDFLDLADDALKGAGLVGVLQIASFHPDYQFAGTEPEDIGNATNRSPHPTLQLLREASVERAVGGADEADTEALDADRVVDANLQTLEALGAAGWAALRDRCRHEALAAVGRA